MSVCYVYATSEGTFVENVNEDGSVSVTKVGTGPTKKVSISQRKLGLKDKAEEEDITEMSVKERCEKERKKEITPWQNVSIEQVLANHEKTGKGMLYGIEFPWSEEGLIQLGPKWLTKAFQTAGTLHPKNKVTKIIPEKKIKISTGNNGGKFLFEVVYKKKSANLHTKMFAKIPHAVNNITKNDRLSSSVYKQPAELHELNTSRLLEADFPCKLPKLYFGDINNETTNWILITEALAFKDPLPQDFSGPSDPPRGPLKPYEIEGPYDKCMDWNLRGDHVEYYLSLIRAGALIAGRAKNGAFGSNQSLSKNFAWMESKPPEMWGVHPGCTGPPAKQTAAKVESGVSFITDDGAVLYPEFCKNEDWAPKFRKIQMTMNAYAQELFWYRCKDEEYLCFTHVNANVDNAYFWRDEEGKLDCGLLDFGGFGQSPIGHRLWWWLYCADYEPMFDNLDRFMQCYVDAYAEAGGPKLDKDLLRKMTILSACEHMNQLVAAVPQIYKMCNKKEWPTIKDRYDPRIGLNIDGKSTIRLYLHVMNSIVRLQEDVNANEFIEAWTDELVELLGMPKKDEAVIFG